ncbi:aldo/keto reductase [Microbacteriaceae bacterium VKM Ac-2855]|nr:aldo/keto reductase [Microbacteriaceae bacterium VKM Ac-2855]
MTSIQYRTLGSSGLVVSSVGLGCNNFGRANTPTQTQEGTDAVIGAALDAGVTLFDTADIYGAERGLSETLMGNALRGRRDDVVLATKFGMDMDGVNGADFGARGSRRYIRRAVESSLRRLQTDWIDLYQLHQPDPSTPMEETLSTLDDLVREGKVRYLGHSNLAGWQIADAAHIAAEAGFTPFVSAQNEYSLIVRDAEEEVLPAARHFGVGFLPFFPLYNGLLTGKYSRGGGPERSRLVAAKPQLLESAPWDALDAYETFCRERGIEMLDATFAWLLAQPGLSSVIAGATSADQIIRNVAAGAAWAPTTDEIAEIGELFA